MFIIIHNILSNFVILNCGSTGQPLITYLEIVYGMYGISDTNL